MYLNQSELFIKHLELFKKIGELADKQNKEIYLILFNHHEGYYSHGFEMKDNETLIFDGYL